jgi:hypothetical protein
MSPWLLQSLPCPKKTKKKIKIVIKQNVARSGSLLQWHRNTTQGRRICTIAAAGMHVGGSWGTRPYQYSRDEPTDLCECASTGLSGIGISYGIFYSVLCNFNPELWQVHSTILAYVCLILGFGSLNKCYASETRSNNYG